MKADIQRPDMPNSLFKYVTADRIDILENGSIRFTQPSVLNDPFEMSADVVSAREGDRNEQSFFLEVLNAAAHFVRSNSGDYLGVLSLTIRPDNLLMWAHYAGEHSGFLIEFDACHKFFDQRTSPDDLLRCLQPVSYSEKRPAVGWMGYALALLTKSRQWEYEQEWRMIAPLEESSSKLEDKGGGIHLFEFPAASVKGLVLGCQMKQERREEIVDLLASDKRYSHVLVQHARQEPNRYALRLTGKGSIHFGYAAKALATGDKQGAYEAVDRAIALEPDNYEYLARRGRLKFEEEPAAARVDLERAVELNPFASDLWALLCIEAHQQNNLSRALKFIDEAIIHDLENPEYWWYRAGLKNETEQYGSAIVDLDRAIELKSNDAKYYSYRAGNHKKLGHTDLVRDDIERAIELAPTVAKYPAMLAQIFEEHQDWTAAVRAYSEAIRLDSSQTEAYLGRARMHREMNNLEASISDLDEVIALSDDPARFYGLRAELFTRMGDHAAAEQDAVRLRTLDPEMFIKFFPNASL